MHYAKNNVLYKAKAIKTSDINTASAWLISRDITN